MNSSDEIDSPPVTASAPPAPRVFLRFFIPVWLLVVITAVLITFILPESFRAVARVRAVSEPGAVLERLRAEATLSAVSQQLNLANRWGELYTNERGAKLQESEVARLLRMFVKIQPISGGALIEIQVFSHRPEEAAEIANALAVTTRPQAEIVDQAVPPLRPIRPNKPLNIFLGVMVGTVLGSLVGLVAVRLSRGFGTKSGFRLVLR